MAYYTEITGTTEYFNKIHNNRNSDDDLNRNDDLSRNVELLK